MSIPKTVEQKLLQNCTTLIKEGTKSLSRTDREDFTFQLFEQMAHQYSGVEVKLFRSYFPIQRKFDESVLQEIASKVLFEISQTKISTPVAVSALLGPDLDWHNQKKTGAFYSDFRLADYLAQKSIQRLSKKSPKILDPACGSGILLVSFIDQLLPKKTKQRDLFIEKNVFASDLSPNALRKTFITLSFFTNNKVSLVNLNKHLVNVDSLFGKNEVWSKECPEGFDLVIGNPPWERLKITYYEELKKEDNGVIYGSHSLKCEKYRKEINKSKDELKSYIKELKTRFQFQGKGEADLYKMFTELSHILTKKDGGVTALIIPGGFIRSQGSTDLRRLLFKNSLNTQISLFDNKKHYFNIDTRFKFITLVASKDKTSDENKVTLEYTSEKNYIIKTANFIHIPVLELEKIREDLSVPEVKNKRDWTLFKKINLGGVCMSSPKSMWKPSFRREIDMTKGKELFTKKAAKGALPVIEGRMVHQFSFFAKKYISGSGRSASWTDNLFDPEQKITPQFYLYEKDVPKESKTRINQWRIGFCDITGQTNERTILASWIPPKVICGNKVPTICFNYGDDELANLWLGIVNSFVFDWLARRVVTTSVNYFILKSIPLPKIKRSNLKACKRISDLVEEISFQRYTSKEEYQSKRAEIEALVIKLYKLTVSDINTIFEDFPLIDKKMKSKQKHGSSVTKNYVLYMLNKIGNKKEKTKLFEEALQQQDNSVAFVPSYIQYPIKRLS